MAPPTSHAPGPVEIERKFLVTGQAWREGAAVEQLSQGYLPTTDDCSVRVRIAGARAFLTIKGPARDGVRAEFEYPVPVDHAAAMLHQFCGGRMIAKRRHSLTHDGRVWTVDEFEGPLAGLVLAEMLSGKQLIVERDPYRAMYRVAHEDQVLPESTPAEADA